MECSAELHPGTEQQRRGRFRTGGEDDRQLGGAQSLHVVQEKRRALPQVEGIQRRLEAIAGVARERTAPGPGGLDRLCCGAGRLSSAGA